MKAALNMFVDSEALSRLESGSYDSIVLHRKNDHWQVRTYAAGGEPIKVKLEIQADECPETVEE
ncbi:MAG: hypothetical protein AAFX93_14140 [Verrucomicrobiota bacterium]